MTPFVRPAGPGDIDAVAGFLHDRMNGKIPRERWRLLLDYPWRPSDVERGWIVEHEGVVAGFMGTVYSDRDVGERTTRFCDLSSWYLDRALRGSGVGDELLRAGMERPGVTYQTMTARRATGRKIRALGFQVLDETRSVFLPDGTRTRGRPAAITDPAAVRERLSPQDRRAFDLHRDFDLHHAFFEELDLWVCYQRKLKGPSLAYHEVLHASDTACLSAHAQDVADVLVEGDRGLLAIDSRFMQEGDDRGRIEPIVLPRWYRPVGVAPRQVDHLYSEVILLDQKLP